MRQVGSPVAIGVTERIRAGSDTGHLTGIWGKGKTRSVLHSQAQSQDRKDQKQV